MWVCFVNLPNSQIELIEPYGEASPIHGFLAKNPKGGQHHICFEVENIHEARDSLVAKGATVLGRTAHRGPRHLDHLRSPQGHGRHAGRAHGNAQGGASLMGPITCIAVYLTIWWTTLFAVLPLEQPHVQGDGDRALPLGAPTPARRSIRT